jgi:ABC-2 type transport system permease protein
VGASFRAEALKLGRRPAVWVLAAVWFVLVVLFGYVLTYLVFANPPEGSFPPGTDPRDFIAALFPENLLSNVLSGFPSTGGGPVALILGALALGSEYGWGTFKTAFTQRPGRLAVFFGKILLLAAAVAALVLLAFGAGAISSYAIARLEGVAVEWPPPGETLRALGCGFLISAVWTSLGAFLATLFRGTPLAIGLGLVYALLLEGIAATLLAANERFKPALKFLFNENSYALINSFGPASGGLGVPQSTVEPERAAITLAAYTLIFVLLSALLLRRRDVA